LTVEVRRRLVGLLDYVEQVVRLDERVAFRLSEYQLSDGSTFAITKSDTENLPGVRHDIRDDEGGQVWLEVERLARKEPPRPPDELAEWIVLSPNPEKVPEARPYRLVTVDAARRDEALAKAEVRPDDVRAAPRKSGEPENAPPRFDLTLRLEDRSDIAKAIDEWIAGPWTHWAAEEVPRRRTIKLYQQMYKVFQLLEVGAAESSIELMWGIGSASWQKDSKLLDRPLLERRVEIELDDAHGGLIRVRPTAADPLFDLKPYEELGCSGLASLSDLIRREVKLASESEGISPFARETFEPILCAAGARLDPDAAYVALLESPAKRNPEQLTFTDNWVLFARPRSQHVVLQDIDRLRRNAEDEETSIGGVAERLVTAPSQTVGADGWLPLSTVIGGSTAGEAAAEPEISFGDVFFPKPFNSDQVEIIRRISGADGLVVQGPPGTGKTHTIANLICHAMATGQRVLVVSRSESALAVLKEQLPEEVRPLAIAVLSNERQGLRQVENAIREIQTVTEGTSPQKRLAAINKIEKEIQELRQRVQAIDRDLESFAEAHLSKVGPRAETPADLAKRIVSEGDAHRWFVDRPARFASESGIADLDVLAASEARRRIGDLIDHLGVVLPSPADLPDADAVAKWHEDLVAAAQHGDAARSGPARSLHVAQEDAYKALALAGTLDDVARVAHVIGGASWAAPLWKSSVAGESDALCQALRDRLREIDETDEERAKLLKRAVDLPAGILDSEDATAAIGRAASGQRMWPLVAVGKGNAKGLVGAVRLDGSPPKDGDAEGWKHVAAVLANAMRQRETHARWDAFARSAGIPDGGQRRTPIEFSRGMLAACDAARAQSQLLSSIVAKAFNLDALASNPSLCAALAAQIRAAASAARLAAVDKERRWVRSLFENKGDRTSALVLQLLDDVIGSGDVQAGKVAGLWRSVLRRLEELKARVRDFEEVEAFAAKLSAAGARAWAKRVIAEKPGPDGDPVLPASWRDAWDHAAADAHLSRIDQRVRLAKLAAERQEADNRGQKLFGELVRERTFYELNRRLSPFVKAALVTFVSALLKIPKSKDAKSGPAARRAAREAMAKCYDAVPCWIMPTWRVAEHLPPEINALELVIIDEASQSDVTELPALLRGKKIIVVGDDRQVSPTAPFVTQQKIAQLRHHFLGGQPFNTLLEPGESIYNLMRAVFPNQRLMLKEHFRCVEPIIRFSMEFYPEKMLPLRIPAANERIDPPLLDIYLPHGSRARHRKVNEAEADDRQRDRVAHCACRHAEAHDRGHLPDRRGAGKPDPRQALASGWRGSDAAPRDLVRRQRDVPGHSAGHRVPLHGRRPGAQSRSDNAAVRAALQRRGVPRPRSRRAGPVREKGGAEPGRSESAPDRALREPHAAGEGHVRRAGRLRVHLRARRDEPAAGARLPRAKPSRLGRIPHRHRRGGRERSAPRRRVRRRSIPRARTMAPGHVPPARARKGRLAFLALLRVQLLPRHGSRREGLARHTFADGYPAGHRRRWRSRVALHRASRRVAGSAGRSGRGGDRGARCARSTGFAPDRRTRLRHRRRRQGGPVVLGRDAPTLYHNGGRQQRSG
jgi:AAA domain-containing protein